MAQALVLLKLEANETRMEKAKFPRGGGGDCVQSAITVNFNSLKKDLLWVWGPVSEGLHGELAQRAEHQEGIFLQDVREAGGAVGALQGLGVLTQRKSTSRQQL